MPSDTITLSREDRAVALEQIKAHLRRETGEEPGDLACLLLFDFVVEELAPLFFNAGIDAAQQTAHRAADSLDAELEAVKRTVRRPGERRPGG